MSFLCQAGPPSSLTWHPLTWNMWNHGTLHWVNLWSWCSTDSYLCPYWDLSDPSRVSGYHLLSWLDLSRCDDSFIASHCGSSLYTTLNLLRLILGVLDWYIVLPQHCVLFFSWEHPYSTENILSVHILSWWVICVSIASRCACIFGCCGIIFGKCMYPIFFTVSLPRIRYPSGVCDLEHGFSWCLTSREEYCCAWPCICYQWVTIPGDDHLRELWSPIPEIDM